LGRADLLNNFMFMTNKSMTYSLSFNDENEMVFTDKNDNISELLNPKKI